MGIIRQIGRIAKRKFGIKQVMDIPFCEGMASDPALVRYWYWYLRLARFFATHGISPPLSVSSSKMAVCWRDDPPSNPSFFVNNDPTIDLLFADVEPYLEKDSSILEIGCNVGRALQWLRERGYADLTGIEIGKQAMEMMEETFPGLKGYAKIIEGNAPEVLRSMPDKSYDLVFARAVLVNIGVKYNYIFKEMSRVSRRFILTMEAESSYLAYPRDFRALIEREQFKEILSRTVRGDASLPVPFTDFDLFKKSVLRLFVFNQSVKGIKSG